MTPEEAEEFWADDEQRPDYRAAVRSFVDQSKAVAAVERERDELRAERDKAREECGHEKAMRASISEEMYRWIAMHRQQKERAEKAEATLARVDDAVSEHPHCIGECVCAVEAVRAALKGGDDAA